MHVQKTKHRGVLHRKAAVEGGRERLRFHQNHDILLGDISKGGKSSGQCINERSNTRAAFGMGQHKRTEIGKAVLKENRTSFMEGL